MQEIRVNGELHANEPVQALIQLMGNRKGVVWLVYVANGVTRRVLVPEKGPNEGTVTALRGGVP